ncbi:MULTISPECIES: TetR/AcrR family transcriptional regulator [unclassified Paludibacterium]|uniref:TetR/AcrR family transcriptional regulator n=1 Tax=unclassified Paludibacterium TaxID=2618429 RepID=UPI001C0486D2|nr:TetR/AcrR family transcriptional regulator [Paludibacterium sp. B53371]BEV71088.1 TetR/AcrR family transcriptional regulator [Paludibacterium sp. THUN1379]
MTTESPSVRQHIIDTAKPIILGKGYAAVGLSEILAAAEVPKGSFYHYFKSKDAFGEAMLTHYFEDYLARLDALLAADGSPAAQRLMRYWQGWCDRHACDGPESKCLVVKLGGEVSDLSEAMRETLNRGTDEVIRRLGACIEEGRADGSMAGIGDAHAAAESLYQMWLGAMLLSKIRRDGSPLQVALKATRQLLQLD